jgi:hypothetical protein
MIVNGCTGAPSYSIHRHPMRKHHFCQAVDASIQIMPTSWMALKRQETLERV